MSRSKRQRRRQAPWVEKGMTKGQWYRRKRRYSADHVLVRRGTFLADADGVSWAVIRRGCPKWPTVQAISDSGEVSYIDPRTMTAAEGPALWGEPLRLGRRVALADGSWATVTGWGRSRHGRPSSRPVVHVRPDKGGERTVLLSDLEPGPMRLADGAPLPARGGTVYTHKGEPRTVVGASSRRVVVSNGAGRENVARPGRLFSEPPTEELLRSLGRAPKRPGADPRAGAPPARADRAKAPDGAPVG